MSTAGTAVTSHEELVRLVGVPEQRVLDEVRPALADLDRDRVAASPFGLVATSDAQGRCDVSPEGDPSGVARVLDDRTLVLPDRPGNRRVDGSHDVLDDPRACLLPPDALPSTAVLAERSLQLEEAREDVERYDGKAYSEGLYRA